MNKAESPRKNQEQKTFSAFDYDSTKKIQKLRKDFLNRHTSNLK